MASLCNHLASSKLKPYSYFKTVIFKLLNNKKNIHGTLKYENSRQNTKKMFSCSMIEYLFPNAFFNFFQRKKGFFV